MQSVRIDYDGEKKRFLVSLPEFNQEAIEHLKLAPERTYNDKTKTWVLPSTTKNAAHLQEFIKRSAATVSEPANNCFLRIQLALASQQAHLKAVAEQNYRKDAYDGFQPKTEPRKHQIECFNLAKDRDCFAIFFEQGLGKTKSAIDLCEYWVEQNTIQKIIILCPNFVKLVWKKELALHAKLGMPIYTINGSDGFKRYHYLSLAHKEQRCWIVCNYEELLTSVFPELKYEVENFKCAIIGDESTRMKNRVAKSAKEAVVLSAKCKKILALTGTPVTNNPLDFWMQFKFLGAELGFATYAAFQNRYAIMGGFRTPSGQPTQVIKWINLDELKEKVSAFSLRKTKEECLDLPPKVYQTLDIELSTETKKMYKQMKDEAAIELQQEATERAGRVSASNIITKILRLSQITGGTLKMEDGTTTRFNAQPKVEAILTLLEEIEPTHQVIIWARFTEEIRMLHDKLDEVHITNTMNYGNTKTDDREKNIDDFQAGKTRVFIAQPHALGMGVTLTAASYVIYYSNDFSMEARMQSEDRAHRIGQDKTVVYIELIAKNTVDKLVKRALEAKQDLAAFIVDNKLNPFSKAYTEEE
jgi:SNF2 family DNA or RNA helicase